MSVPQSAEEPQSSDGDHSKQAVKETMAGSRKKRSGTQKKNDLEKRFACEECGKRFSRGRHLDTHQRTHSGDKPFLCYECGKSFSKKCNWERHQELHGGEYKPVVTAKQLPRKKKGAS